MHAQGALCPTESQSFQESYQTTLLYLQTPWNRTKHPLGSGPLWHGTKCTTNSADLVLNLGNALKQGQGSDGNSASGNKKMEFELTGSPWFSQYIMGSQGSPPCFKHLGSLFYRAAQHWLSSWGLGSSAGFSVPKWCGCLCHNHFASNEWKQAPDQGTDLGTAPEEMWKGARWISNQLEGTLSLQQSTPGSPRPSKFPAPLLMADKDSPSFQKSHFTTTSLQMQCLNPHGPHWPQDHHKNFVGLFFPSQEYERKSQHCLCATAPVHVGVLAHFYQFFSLSGLDNYEVNVRVHWW